MLGRETFLAPVAWNEDGWPVVNGDGTINLDMKDVKTLPQTTVKNSPDWDFNNPQLGAEWNWIGIPDKKKLFAHGEKRISPDKRKRKKNWMTTAVHQHSWDADRKTSISRPPQECRQEETETPE